MKIYDTQKEVDKDLVDNTLKANDDVRFRFDVIKRFNIDVHNIIADDIKALDIIANNIDALNIDALNINSLDIDANNIYALNITALNIDALNIATLNIDANEISYSTFCIAQQNINCSKITGRSANSFHKCLDGKLIIKGD